jgi:hypothetical protein
MIGPPAHASAAECRSHHLAVKARAGGRTALYGSGVVDYLAIRPGRSRADGLGFMSRSRLLLIAAVVVIAVSAGFFLRKPSETRHAESAPPPSKVGVAMPGPGSTPTPAAAAERAPGEKEKLAEMVDSKKAMEAAADLRHKARFPRTSRRIEDNMDPIVKQRTVQERVSPPGQGSRPTLVVFASSVSYEAPNPIILFAKFIREYPDDWGTETGGEIAGELTNADDVVVAQVDFRDDGQERDIEAGDGVFTAILTPSDDDLDRWTGLIRVKVYGQTSGGDRRSARTRFYYGAAAAWLTGNYRDELAGGHLRLLAEVQVTAPAEYRLDATLSGSRGLLAWAANTVRLEPGTRWIPVNFWGLALRETEQPGPYQLSSIALANVSATPPQLNDATGTSYRTAPYKLEDFSTDRYNDPRLLEKADRYEAKARGETGAQ